jgi:WD40 repeat protein
MTQPPHSQKGLRELDLLANAVFSVVGDQFDQLTSKHGTSALSSVELANILMPYLLCDPVPLHDALRTPERCVDVIRKLVDEATSSRSRGASKIFWDPFIEFLSASSRRHTLREGLRSKSTFRFSGQVVDCGQDIRRYVLVPPMTPADIESFNILVIRDCASRRVVEWLDREWLPRNPMTAHLQSAVSGMATAVAYIPAPYHKAVVSFASSLGASLGFFERNAEGRLALEVPTMTHQTAMQWMPSEGKILCGSALGELSIFSASGRIGPTVVQPHNGPVVFLGHLTIADAFLSAGSEGRLSIVDAGTMTEIRRITALDGHITCASLCAEQNLVAVAGSDPFPVLCNASLPPYVNGVPLLDGKNTHRHNIVDLANVDDLLISLDASGLCKVWDLRTRKCLESHQSPAPDSVKRTATFSRLIRRPATSLDTNDSFVVASSSCGFLLDCSRTTSVDAYVPVADTAPVQKVDVLMTNTIVTLSSSSVRLWSCRSGELESSFVLPTGSVPTAMCVANDAPMVFVGFDDGVIRAIDATALERDDACCSVEIAAAPSPITGLVCVGSLLLVGSLDGTFAAVSSMRPSPMVAVHGVDGFCSYERTWQSTNVAILSLSRRLYVVEPSDDGTVVEDFREYDLNASMRSECPLSSQASKYGIPFCFFGSPSAVCVGDGPDISIISLTASRTRRIMSFASVRGACIACAFDASNGKSVLITLEDDGTCAVFLVTDLLPEVQKRLTKGFLADHHAPTVHCSFVCSGASWSNMVRGLSACVFSMDSCRCTLYRVDGVRIGDLDMNGAPGAAWLSMATKTRRGSHIVFRATTEALNDDHKGTHNPKHSVAFASRPGVRSLQSTADILVSKSIVKQQSFGEKVSALTSNPSLATRTVTVRGERSARTLEPLDAATTRWTTDAPEPKPTRDSLKVLTEMRLFTQGLKPGRSPSPHVSAPARAPGSFGPTPLNRPGKLRPLFPLGETLLSNSASPLELRSSPIIEKGAAV